MIVDTTKTAIERKVQAHSLQEKYFRDCRLVGGIQGHIDSSSVRQSFFSENLRFPSSAEYKRYPDSCSVYYDKGKAIRTTGNTVIPQKHENSVIHSFENATSSIASQIAQKLIDQEWGIMCKLLVACSSKEITNHRIGAEFCQSGFRRFADKNTDKPSIVLINPLDVHKIPKWVMAIECKSVPLCSMFFLPAFDELGAIGVTLEVTATPSGQFSGVFWTEAAYSIIYGEKIVWILASDQIIAQGESDE